MVLHARTLQIDLPKGQSAFLWGARKSGKSTLLKRLFKDSIYYDLLQSDLFYRFSKEPHLLREELLSYTKINGPVIIDEVQKIPDLLDEIHWLIENENIQFILCGSSARKLKIGHTNMLGGRAWRYQLLPFTYNEIPDFDLLKALNAGLIPSHYLSSNPRKSLEAYVYDYLDYEIKAESLVRNLRAFSKFLDSMAFSNGELTNFSNIAKDVGVDAKTVREYYQIIEDTLLGYRVPPFAKKVSRKDIITSTPKFYLFDVGVAGFLAKRHLLALKGREAGHAFEHFILMELVAYKHYSEKKFSINFWRTKTGLEVDFVLEDGKVAIEVKISDRIGTCDLDGIMAFSKEHKPKKNIVVCMEKRSRKTSTDIPIDILPWTIFLKILWQGEIL